MIPDVLILCGGQGTRFKEVRDDIPKAIAPINGVPFIDLLFDSLIDQGCKRIILCTGYLSEKIEEHVKYRNDVEYIISHEKYSLGTGGAVRYALRHVRSEILLTMNGDSYVDFSLQKLVKFHTEGNISATIVLSSAFAGRQYGSVELDDRMMVKEFHEKPEEQPCQYVNAGVYCMNQELIKKEKNKELIKRNFELFSRAFTMSLLRKPRKGAT